MRRFALATAFVAALFAFFNTTALAVDTELRSRFDVNGDGEINVADVIEDLRAAVGLVDPTASENMLQVVVPASPDSPSNPMEAAYSLTLVAEKPGTYTSIMMRLVFPTSVPRDDSVTWSGAGGGNWVSADGLTSISDRWYYWEFDGLRRTTFTFNEGPRSFNEGDVIGMIYFDAPHPVYFGESADDIQVYDNGSNFQLHWNSVDYVEYPVSLIDPEYWIYGDVDHDGVVDRDRNFVPVDNCPTDANNDQADMDGDGVGDACDPEPTNEFAP